MELSKVLSIWKFIVLIMTAADTLVDKIKNFLDEIKYPYSDELLDSTEDIYIDDSSEEKFSAKKMPVWSILEVKDDNIAHKDAIEAKEPKQDEYTTFMGPNAINTIYEGINSYKKGNKNEKHIYIGNYGANKTNDKTPRKVRVQDFATHGYIPGSTGAGKSTLIINMLAQVAEYDNNFLFITPKAEDVERLVQSLDEESLEKVDIFKPGMEKENIATDERKGTEMKNQTKTISDSSKQYDFVLEDKYGNYFDPVNSYLQVESQSIPTNLTITITGKKTDTAISEQITKSEQIIELRDLPEKDEEFTVSFNGSIQDSVTVKLFRSMNRLTKEVGLNPFDTIQEKNELGYEKEKAAMLNTFVGTITSIWGGGARINVILQAIARLMIDSERNYTMADFILVIENEEKRKEFLDETRNELDRVAPVSRLLYQEDAYDQEDLEPLIRRINDFDESEMRNVFYTSETDLNYKEYILGDRSLIVDLSDIETNYIPYVTVPIIGRLWFFAYRVRDRLTTEADRRVFFNVIDEAQYVITANNYKKANLDDVLQQGRSFKFSLLLASQSPIQFPNVLLDEMDANVRLTFAMDAGEKGNKFIADESLNVGADDIGELEDFTSYTLFPNDSNEEPKKTHHYPLIQPRRTREETQQKKIEIIERTGSDIVPEDKDYSEVSIIGEYDDASEYAEYDESGNIIREKLCKAIDLAQRYEAYQNKDYSYDEYGEVEVTQERVELILEKIGFKEFGYQQFDTLLQANSNYVSFNKNDGILKVSLTQDGKDIAGDIRTGETSSSGGAEHARYMANLKELAKYGVGVLLDKQEGSGEQADGIMFPFVEKEQLPEQLQQLFPNYIFKTENETITEKFNDLDDEFVLPEEEELSDSTGDAIAEEYNINRDNEKLQESLEESQEFMENKLNRTTIPIEAEKSTMSDKPAQGLKNVRKGIETHNQATLIFGDEKTAKNAYEKTIIRNGYAKIYEDDNTKKLYNTNKKLENVIGNPIKYYLPKDVSRSTWIYDENATETNQDGEVLEYKLADTSNNTINILAKASYQEIINDSIPPERFQVYAKQSRNGWELYTNSTQTLDSDIKTYDKLSEINNEYTRVTKPFMPKPEFYDKDTDTQKYPSQENTKFIIIGNDKKPIRILQDKNTIQPIKDKKETTNDSDTTTNEQEQKQEQNQKRKEELEEKLFD